jgi:uncharacterized spore protein YtfJ
MDVREALEQVRESMGAKRVYGKPVKQAGVTVIPAARISGGAGGGTQNGGKEDVSGSGAGFGMRARPVGAFVIEDGTVRWKPAVDLVQLGVLAVVLLIGIRSIARILSRP